MRAERGDWLVIEGASVGQAPRVGRILEVRAGDGSPPYLVRWVRAGYTTLIVPGPDARLVPASQMDSQGNGVGSARPARFWRRILSRWIIR